MTGFNHLTSRPVQKFTSNDYIPRRTMSVEKFLNIWIHEPKDNLRRKIPGNRWIIFKKDKKYLYIGFIPEFMTNRVKHVQKVERKIIEEKFPIYLKYTFDLWNTLKKVDPEAQVLVNLPDYHNRKNSVTFRFDEGKYVIGDIIWRYSISNENFQRNYKITINSNNGTIKLY